MKYSLSFSPKLPDFNDWAKTHFPNKDAAWYVQNAICSTQGFDSENCKQAVKMWENTNELDTKDTSKDIQGIDVEKLKDEFLKIKEGAGFQTGFELVHDIEQAILNSLAPQSVEDRLNNGEVVRVTAQECRHENGTKGNDNCRDGSAWCVDCNQKVAPPKDLCSGLCKEKYVDREDWCTTCNPNLLSLKEAGKLAYETSDRLEAELQKSRAEDQDTVQDGVQDPYTPEKVNYLINRLEEVKADNKKMRKALEDIANGWSEIKESRIDTYQTTAHLMQTKAKKILSSLKP